MLLAYYRVHEARLKLHIQKISYQKEFSWKLDKCEKYSKCRLILIGYICTVLQRRVCFNLSNQWFPVTATSSITQKGSLKGCSSIVELRLQVKVLFVQIACDTKSIQKKSFVQIAGIWGFSENHRKSIFWLSSHCSSLLLQGGARGAISPSNNVINPSMHLFDLSPLCVFECFLKWPAQWCIIVPRWCWGAVT